MTVAKKSLLNLDSDPSPDRRERQAVTSSQHIPTASNPAAPIKNSAHTEEVVYDEMTFEAVNHDHFQKQESDKIWSRFEWSCIWGALLYCGKYKIPEYYSLEMILEIKNALKFSLANFKDVNNYLDGLLKENCTPSSIAAMNDNLIKEAFEKMSKYSYTVMNIDKYCGLNVILNKFEAKESDYECQEEEFGYNHEDFLLKGQGTEDDFKIRLEALMHMTAQQANEQRRREEKRKLNRAQMATAGQPKSIAKNAASGAKLQSPVPLLSSQPRMQRASLLGRGDPMRMNSQSTAHYTRTTPSQNYRVITSYPYNVHGQSSPTGPIARTVRKTTTTTYHPPKTVTPVSQRYAVPAAQTPRRGIVTPPGSITTYPATLVRDSRYQRGYK